jgi:hypothetical protein
MKVKARHLYVDAILESVAKVQNQGPIDILVGKFGEVQEVFKVVFIIASFALDNEEAHKIQGISFNYTCPSNCRLCNMPSKEFYTFGSFKNINSEDVQNQYNITRNGEGNITPMQLLNLYIMINESKYGPRNTEDNNLLSEKAEKVWWKQVMFNKNRMPNGRKILHLSNEEKELLYTAKSRNLKSMHNIVMSSILQPFFSRNGTRPTIIPGDWIFAPDKMHTLWKGPIEYCLRYASMCLMLQGQLDDDFKDNICLLDVAILEFDIYQPLTSWGDIPPRRLSGISGKLTVIYLIHVYLFTV